MTEVPLRSYDDLPESDVATVLEVPLLWGGPARPPGSAVPPAGRHRAQSATVLPEPPASRPRTAPRWTDHPVVQVLHVGVVSALLVLILFGLVLLALARWMP